jgi:hypothetical protein
MAKVLTDPHVVDAMILGAMAVVAAAIVAIGLAAAWRRFAEFSGDAPKKRRR